MADWFSGDFVDFFENDFVDFFENDFVEFWEEDFVDFWEVDFVEFWKNLPELLEGPWYGEDTAELTREIYLGPKNEYQLPRKDL